MRLRSPTRGLVACVAFAFMVAAGCAERGAGELAQVNDFPSKPVTVVVPFGAGGGSDLLSRTLAGHIRPHLGQEMTVELQPGGSGVIASTRFVTSAEPDGHTLIIVGTSATTTIPHQQDVQYDPIEDFEFITGFVLNTEVLAVRSDFPADTPEEFIEYVQERPGQVRLGNTGTGGEDWAAIQFMSKAFDTEIVPVPFEGGGEAATAAAGKHVDGSVTSYPSAAPLVEAGKLKIIGVLNSERSDALPDIPTFAELGYEDVAVNSRLGLAAPKGTPPEIVKKLDVAFQKTIDDPGFKRLAERRDFGIDYLGPDDFRSALKSEYERMRTAFS